MIFNSFQFILFLVLIVAVYWLLRRVRPQNVLLLIASYIFYGTWDWRFLSLILISTVVDYNIGLRLDSINDPRKRRLLLITSIVVNLGFLGFFKYFNFFTGSAISFFASLGLQVNEFSLNVILPVGISFYTFQTLSYTIDVYQRKLEPTHSLLNFALFVAFFPQLVAGPIERAARLLPQMERQRSLTPDAAESGMVLILLGLFKKMVIADVAASMIDPQIFLQPGSFAGGQVLLSVYLFALQIYGDFAGYSDIARGSSRLLGIELMENFNQPYFSQTVSEFWRRWHISLSTWFRDYVYIPLSDSLKGSMNNVLLVYALSAMITMLLSGLWHGANWTFVIWGGLLGIYLVISRPFRGWVTLLLEHRLGAARHLTVLLRVFLTFHLILISWVLFRTPEMQHVPGVYRGMWEALGGNWDPEAVQMIVPVLLLYVVSFALDAGQVVMNDHAFVRRLAAPLRTALYAAAIFFMMFFSVKPYVPFIYFQF